MVNKNIKIRDVIADGKISFGTSGARGLVVDFTAEICYAFSQAFAHVLAENYSFKTIGLAIDNRPSSIEIAKFCSSALYRMGISCKFFGVIPTPALAFKCMNEGIPAIMVTGSHIPFDRNGLKFYRPDGEITKDDEIAIYNCSSELLMPTHTHELHELKVLNSASEEYIKRYTTMFAPTTLAGKRIGIYEHSSAGRDLYNLIFSALGAEVISIGRSEDFVPIDTEAVSDEDRRKARKWANEYKLDAIFSTDGDGDRPLLADENGEWLCGDILGLLCSYILSIEAISIPVSCNTAIELSGKFKKVVRTKIGSPFVINAFSMLKDKYKSFAGFEANGGFLLGSNVQFNGANIAPLPTRDAVLPALMVIAGSSNSSISKLKNNLPARFTFSSRLKNFPTEKSRCFIKEIINNPDDFIKNIGFSERNVSSINHTDGARFILDNGDIVHLRPSGNAPELRCYAEASKESIAQHYVSCALNFMSTL